jgi:hypothetical protein
MDNTAQINGANIYGEIAINKAEIPDIEKEFIQNVREFMRLREQVILKQQCYKSDYSKKVSKSFSNETVTIKDKELRNLIKICKRNVDYEENGNLQIGYYMTNVNDQRDGNSSRNTMMNEIKDMWHSLIEIAWHKIREHLDDLKDNSDMSAYAVKYTTILKQHIENKLPLDHLCIIGLVSCIQPSYIEDIFNLNLIDSATKLHCLFKPSNYCYKI